MTESFVSTLIWVDGDKGYGFMVPYQGQETFVRYTPADGRSFRILNEGSQFRFTIKDGPRGPVATDITPVS